jgi:hypothetical protein
VLELGSAFARAWLQPTRPSWSALVFEKSRVLRPKFVQPGCTGEFVHPGCTTTANRIPSSALIARDRLGRDAMRHTAGLASGFWTISDSRRQGFVGRATLCGILRNLPVRQVPESAGECQANRLSNNFATPFEAGIRNNSLLVASVGNWCSPIRVVVTSAHFDYFARSDFPEIKTEGCAG